MSRIGRPNVAAIAFDGNALDVVAKLRQLAGKRLADDRLHSGGGFDVDELAREGEDVHLGRIDQFLISPQGQRRTGSGKHDSEIVRFGPAESCLDVRRR